MDVSADEQRALFRRWPAGVSVVAAEAAGCRGGMTVSSLISLSLDSHLVGISIARAASLRRTLEASGGWAVSILSADQEEVAKHFARSLEPAELWAGIAVRTDDSRLIQDAVGWLVARTVDVVKTGDHTLFVGEVTSCEHGPAKAALAYVHRRYFGV